MCGYRTQATKDFIGAVGSDGHDPLLGDQNNTRSYIYYGAYMQNGQLLILSAQVVHTFQNSRSFMMQNAHTFCNRKSSPNQKLQKTHDIVRKKSQKQSKYF